MGLSQRDEALVEEFFTGSDESFIEIVSNYETKVFNTALYLTNDAKDAEDVLQTVFLSLYKKLNEDRGSISLFKWLVEETLNTAVAKLVEQRDIEEDSQVERLTNDMQVLSRSFKKRNPDIRNLFQNAVRELPRDIRAVFLLSDVLGLEREKVCGILAVTDLEARSKLMRTRKEISKALVSTVSSLQVPVNDLENANSNKVFYLRA